VTSPGDILDALGITETANNPQSRSDLSPEELRVVELVASPLSRDELIRALKLPTFEANVLLSTMELKGVIVEELGTIRVR